MHWVEQGSIRSAKIRTFYEIRADFRKKADSKVRTECVNVLILKHLS